MSVPIPWKGVKLSKAGGVFRNGKLFLISLGENDMFNWNRAVAVLKEYKIKVIRSEARDNRKSTLSINEKR